MTQKNLLIIGGGNMASAIVRGALQRGFSADRFTVAEPDAARRAAFQALGVRTNPAATREIVGALPPGDQILLAIKPQSLPDLAAQLRPLGPRVVISILAGTTTARIADALGGAARVVRIMPNTPARIGLGCAALALGTTTLPEDAALARDLFSAVGIVLDLPEAQFDAFTALAGSGPAYLFLLAEAMARAGAVAGLPPDIADAATRQTLHGAAALLAQTPDAPEALRAAVTSRGGTTEAALAALDPALFIERMATAIRAARDRGATLSA